MKSKKSKISKGLAVLLIAIIACVGTNAFAMTIGASTEYAYTYDIDRVSYEKQTPTIEDDFAGDRVIVTLKPSYSDVNKSFSAQSFKTENVVTAHCPGSDSISRQNNEHLSADFADNSENADLTEKTDKIINKIVIESVTDLTKMKNPSKIVKRDSFVQILSIQLRENSKEGVLKAIEELEQLEMVLAAEPDYFIEAKDLWQPPNDTGFNQQWALGAAPGIRAQQAWTMTNGTTTPNRIRVGIFETGLDNTHPDLRVIPGNMVSGVATHGTHVGGIIGAITNNNQGVSGIAQVELALLDRGNGGALSDTNQGVFPASLIWAIDNDIRIVNCSFRFLLNGVVMRQPIAAHREAIRVFGENGGLLVASAANDTEDLDAIRQYPAAYGDTTAFPEIDNVITVGSIDSNGGLSNFSNWGANSVHIYVPGRNILSTVPRGDTPVGYRRHSDGYAYADGTSMAAPQVAGVAALMLSVNPNLTPQQIRTNIINSGTAVTLTTPNTSIWPWQNNSITFNSVRLDAFAAVSNVANFTYRAVTGGIEITGVPRALVGSVAIPSTINGQTLTAIANSAFANQTQLSQISIPSSVTTIGNDAFKNTNNASIYLDGKTTVPSTFSYYWNPSGNPVYLNGNLCTHTFKTTIELNETQHGDYCFDCRTLTNKTNHSKYISGEWEKCHYCPYSKFLGHTHSYTYTWLNLQEHKRSCSCGDSRTTPHIISGSWNGQGYTTCLACGGPANSGLILQGIDPPSNAEGVNDHINQYFGNESFILNNGVIVLSELDIVKYYDGTLILPYECDGLDCCYDDIDLNGCCYCSNNYINEFSSVDSNNSNKDLYLPSRREYYISINQ